MKRKILLLVLGTIMILSFAACENEEKSSESAHSDVTSDAYVSDVSEESLPSEEMSEDTEKINIVSFKGEDDFYKKPPQMGELVFSEKVLEAFEKYNDGELFALKLRWQIYVKNTIFRFTDFIYEDDSFKEIFEATKFEQISSEGDWVDSLPAFIDFLTENDVSVVNLDDKRFVYILVSEEQIKNLEIPDSIGAYVYLHNAAEYGYSDSELEYFDSSNESEENVQNDEKKDSAEKKTIVSFKDKDEYPLEHLPAMGKLELLERVLAAFREYNNGELFFLRLSPWVDENGITISSFTYNGKAFGDIWDTKEWTDEVETAFWEYFRNYYTEFFVESGLEIVSKDKFVYVLATEEQILNLKIPDDLGFFIFLDNAANFGYDESDLEYFIYNKN